MHRWIYREKLPRLKTGVIERRMNLWLKKDQQVQVTAKKDLMNPEDFV